MRRIAHIMQPVERQANAAPVTFAARLRTEAEKIPLRAVCETCQFNRQGICTYSSCCGGKVTIEVKLNLTTTLCPRWKTLTNQKL